MTLILFTSMSPTELAGELSRSGHSVFGALAISEVLALGEQHPEAVIIIAHDVSPERARIVQQRYPTLTLGAKATLKDVLWELGISGTLLRESPKANVN